MNLFVYGTLLSGEPHHAQLRGARPIAVHLTEPRYTLISLGPYPALLDGGTTSVRGEMYAVDDGLLCALDRFEGVPRLYRRALVQLIVGALAVGYLLARAPYEALPVIGGGDWRVYRSASKSAGMALPR